MPVEADYALVGVGARTTSPRWRSGASPITQRIADELRRMEDGHE